MSYEFYKVLHLLGVFMIITSLGGMSLHMINGGTRDYPNRKLIALTHGIGMLFAFVAGFGLLAKLGFMGAMPSWAIGKIVLWLWFGGIPALIYRRPKQARAFFASVVIFATLAAWLAVYKP